MNTIHVNRFGFAIGLSGVLFYIGCILLMNLLGRDNAIQFFNSLLHGLDITSIVKMNVTIGESFIGILLTFILGWFFGVSVSLLYNFSFSSNKNIKQ